MKLQAVTGIATGLGELTSSSRKTKKARGALSPSGYVQELSLAVAQPPAGEASAQAVMSQPKAGDHTLWRAVCPVAVPLSWVSVCQAFYLELDMDAQASAPRHPHLLDFLWDTLPLIFKPGRDLSQKPRTPPPCAPTIPQGAL